MQIFIDKDIDHLINIRCEVCRKKIWKNEMKDIIIFVHGDIEHNIEEHEAFKEISQTIYIHKNCIKSALNNKYHNIWELLFENQ